MTRRQTRVPLHSQQAVLALQAKARLGGVAASREAAEARGAKMTPSEAGKLGGEVAAARRALEMASGALPISAKARELSQLEESRRSDPPGVSVHLLDGEFTPEEAACRIEAREVHTVVDEIPTVRPAPARVSPALARETTGVSAAAGPEAPAPVGLLKLLSNPTAPPSEIFRLMTDEAPPRLSGQEGQYILQQAQLATVANDRIWGGVSGRCRPGDDAPVALRRGRGHVGRRDGRRVDVRV